MKLCCIFNYAPLYRLSIFKKIDETYDTQFYFGNMVSNIEKFDTRILRKKPKAFGIKTLLGHIPWWSGLFRAAFEDCDVFLMTGDFSFSFYPFIIMCHLRGKKVYAWGHGCKSFSGKYRFMKPLYYMWDGFYTYGQGGKDRLVKLGINADKIHVIYNSLNSGVNISFNSGLNSDIYKEHFNNNNPVVLFVGRLTKVKQLDWILEAHKKHLDEGLLYNVIIIGDGDCRDDLTSYVKENQLEQSVWFYGKCYDEEVLNSLIYNADLCVSPGNVGLTALHAMTYGTPVISHDDFESQMPEYETIVPGVTGDLYEHGSFIAFCNTINRWLSNHTNRDEVRENCYSIINGKFNSNYQIQLLEKTLLP